jgi:hypothetical protein
MEVWAGSSGLYKFARRARAGVASQTKEALTLHLCRQNTVGSGIEYSRTIETLTTVTRVEQGINPLFDDRAEEIVLYEEGLIEALGRRQKPDRIFGLRRTKVFERLLSESTVENGKLLKHSIHYTPFDFCPEPLLFPFLIIEAKS